MNSRQGKNIGTLSININAPDFNYGAILHSWAFQHYLIGSGLAAETEIINYKMPQVELFNRWLPIRYYFSLGKRRKALEILKKYRIYGGRLIKFNRFIRKDLRVSRRKYTTESLNKEKLPYDMLIVESDIVWNCWKNRGFNNAFFLGLDSMKGKKRIAYTPSMADAEVPEEALPVLKEYLQDLDAVSCRESYEAELIGKVLQQPVKHLLDPVFLPEAEDYDRITAPRILGEPYLLIYLPVNDNESLRKSAQEYAEKTGLKTLEISTKLNHGKTEDCLTLGNAGVEEFLSALRYADMIFTNSFHAICFAVIFEKQFYAFTRVYQKKVIDICKTFGLEDRYMTDDRLTERAPIDYSAVRALRDRLQEESRRWLAEQIGK